LAGGWTRTTQRSGGASDGTDTYTGTGLILGGTWTGAPAGDYRLDIDLSLICPGGNAAGTLAVSIGGTVVSPSGARLDVPTFLNSAHLTYIWPNWSGGDLNWGVAHSVGSAAVKIHNASSKGVLQYLGKR
jgi:hypothetical protein